MGLQVGCLLGKGGSIIQDLRRQSTAQIRIMPRDTIPKCARATDELVQVRSALPSPASGGWPLLQG